MDLVRIGSKFRASGMELGVGFRTSRSGSTAYGVDLGLELGSSKPHNPQAAEDPATSEARSLNRWL